MLSRIDKDDGCPTGPVRAVAIHPSRALLATGGGDYKIKVWGRLIYLITVNLHLIYTRSTTSKQALSIHYAWTP
jgi:hypothetical protein